MRSQSVSFSSLKYLTANIKDEENDYNTEAIAEDNSRDGHIFESVMTLQAWLEATFGDRHIEPCIVPDPRENEDQETAHE